MNAKLKTLVQALIDEINEAKGQKNDQTSITPWWETIEWKTPEYSTLFDSLAEETRQLIIDAGLCPTCGEDAPRSEAERAMSHFNISEEDWGKLSDEEKQAYINKLPERGSGGSEDDAEDVLETNPGFAPGEAEEECPEGHEWNAEKKQCVPIADFSDDPENKKVDAAERAREVLDKADRLL